MNKNTVDQILNDLMQMQEMDVRIAELEISKVYKPKLLSDLRSTVTTLEEKLSAADKNIVQIKLKQNQTALSIDKIKEQLARSKEKLSKVTSNREYEAAQDEIIENEELLAMKEEDLLRIYDEEEIIQKEHDKLKEEYDATQADTQKKISDIEDELSHVEENIRVIESQRNQIAVNVPKRLMFTYDRIRKGLGNYAIVSVKQRACGGCFQQLPPQIIQNIIRGDEIVFCPSCGRILVWNENQSPTAE